MKRVSKFVFLILIALVLLSTAAAAQAQGNAKESPWKDLPPIGGLMVHQIGSDGIIVELKGGSLPLPEMDTIASDHISFYVSGAYLASGKWERDFSLPLVGMVKAEQVENRVVFKIKVNEPMILKKIEGTPPANRYIFRFSATDFVERENVQKDLLAPLAPVFSNPGDPFSKTIPVTLDLRDVELRDVFRMFGEYSKMNIIADPSVPNTMVTMSLKAVPLNEALGYLMRMYDMSYAIMGKTVIIGTADSLGKTTGKESMRQFKIAYADMKAVAGLLTGLTGVNKVVVDERLRAIYVTGRSEQFAEVEKVLQHIDHPGGR